MRSLYLLLSFIFFFVGYKAIAQADAISGCCERDCCYTYSAQLKASPDSVKPIYDRLKTSNADGHIRCCRQMLHLAGTMLAERLPQRCSVNKLIAVLGQPDRVNQELTYLEKTNYGKKIPIQKRWFKKQVYRYDGNIPGRIYLLFIIRFGRVIFWKNYVDVC